MSKRFDSLSEEHRAFIAEQRIFFTASATAESRVNISPRPTDALRVPSDDVAMYLDLTGSGAETAAHLRIDGRLTIMFCALAGAPSILRLYGRGRTFALGTAAYTAALAEHFDGVAPHGARQIVRLDIDLVQTSCGYGVPLFDYREERATLERWTATKSEDGLRAYRREQNSVSLDGLETGFAIETSLDDPRASATPLPS